MLGLGVFRAVSRTGGGLLSRALRHSIIAAGGFNGRVRDGIGWNAPAWAASPANRRISPGKPSWFYEQSGFDVGSERSSGLCLKSFRANTLSRASLLLTEKAIKLNRTIRTGKLKPLLAVHTRPINVVVFHGS